MRLQLSLLVAATVVSAAPPARSQARETLVRVDGQAFESWDDYLTSPLFHGRGLRCGGPEHDPLRFQGMLLPPSDCAYGSTNPTSAYDPGDVLRIQVVVHVIQRSTGTGFIDPAQVQGQIDILNEDFRALAGTNGANGFDSGIEFFLATEDPVGNPTTGITYSTNNTWYDDGGSYWNTLAWDTDRYLNVYTNSAGGYLGYVPDLPQGGIVGSTSDRVVCLWSAFGPDAPIGPPYDQGRTLTHEVGHYLGLYHTFDGGCGTSSCYTTGDRICDTNQESSPHFGCNPSDTSCGSLDPVDNYMDYSDDLCMERFTQEQARRMRCTLQFWRPEVWTVGGGGVEPTEEGINVDVGANGTFPTPGAGYGAASGQSGSWNAVSGSAAASSPVALVDALGEPTPATLSVSGGNGDFEFDNANTSGNAEDLLDDLYDAGSSTWTVTGLLEGLYDVYVYSWAPDDRLTFQSEITVVGGSAGAQVCGGAAWGGSFVYGAHFVRDTTFATGGTLVVEVDQVGGNPSSVNGLQIVPSDGGGGLGVAYCTPAVINSTGSPGVLEVTGSAVVADDDLTLSATQLPLGSNIGYFVMGTGTNVSTPPGSAGPICVTPGLVRLLPPVSNTNELPGGFSRSVGTSGPQTGAITAGSTWNFQAWHRDFLAGASNLTNAVSVTFQ